MFRKILFCSVLLFVIPVTSFGQLRFPQGVGTLNDFNNLRPVDMLDPCDTCEQFQAVFDEDEDFANRLQFYYQRLRPTDSIIYYPNAIGTYLSASPSVATAKVSVNNDPWVEIGPMSSVYNADQGVGPVEFVTFYPGNTNIMLTGSTEGGLFYSSNGGASWVNAGTDVLTISTSGVKGAVFDPNDVNAQTWFALNSGLGDLEAAPIGIQPGILRTADGGATYYNIFDYNNAGGFTGLIMNKLLIDPNNAGTLYVATNIGVFKTTNANAGSPSWTKLTIPFPSTMSTMSQFSGCTCANDPFFVGDIEFLPGSTAGTVNSNELFICASFPPGSGSANPGEFWSVMHSTNAGATGSWSELPSLSDINNYSSLTQDQYSVYFRNLSSMNIEFDPSDNNHAYIMSRNPNNQYCSIWQFDLANSTNNQNIVPAVFVKSSNGEGIAVSNGVVAYSDYFSSTLFDTNDGTYLGIVDNYSSSTGTHVDHEHEDFNPSNPNELWISTHGGPYKVTITRGPLNATWVLETNNLGVAHAMSIGDSYSEDGFITSGFYHIGDGVTRTPYSTSNWAPSFECTQMGDGLHTAVSPIDGDYYIVSTQGAAWQITTDKGASYPPHAIIYPSDFASEAALNKQNKNIAYFVAMSGSQANAYSTIMRTMNFGGSTQAITPDLTSLIASSTGYAIDANKKYKILEAFTPPSSSSYLYVHIIINQQDWGVSPHEKHLFFRTTHADDPVATNVWSTWEYCPWVNENFWPSGLEFDPYDPNIVYIINSSSNIYNYTSTLGQNMIFRMDYTNPASVVPNTCGTQCTDLTYNLPNTGVGHNSIAIEKGSNGGIYIGTDVGIFYINNQQITNGTYWQLFGADLPKVRNTGLAINYKQNKLRAALFGRGIWEHSLLCPSTLGLTESGTYSQSDFKEAQNNIISTASIPSNISMTYRAGDLVDLQPGFTVSGSNTFFHGFIHACNHPGNSFNRYSHGSGNNSISDKISSEGNDTKRAEVVIQPNPNTGSFALMIKSNYHHDNHVEVIDLMGRVVFSKSFIEQSEVIKLDVENGTYLIKYYDGIYSDSQVIIINK